MILFIIIISFILFYRENQKITFFVTDKYSKNLLAFLFIFIVCNPLYYLFLSFFAYFVNLLSITTI